MLNKILKFTSIYVFCFMSNYVLSHHAFTAEFDANAPINITGKVLKVEWINPHAWVHVEVIENDKKTVWMVEGGTPNTLIRNGITKNSIKPGGEITAQVGTLSKKPKQVNNWLKVLSDNFGNSKLDEVMIPSFDCRWNFASSIMNS